MWRRVAGEFPHSSPEGFSQRVMRECLDPSGHRVDITQGTGPHAEGRGSVRLWGQCEYAVTFPVLQMWSPQRRQHGNQRRIRAAAADSTASSTGWHQDRRR